MVIVEIKYKKNKIASITAKGHAGYSNKGNDIVCSAISAVILGGFNAINNKHKIESKDGYASYSQVGKLSKHDEIVLDTILVQLYSIQNSYPKYIDIKLIR